MLSNALRHTPQGGRIAISIESSAEWVSFALFNTGVGIPEEHLAKLCDRFYRADMARATHTGGLGLGLAIVKSIMDLHRGTLNIKSQINSGTEVQLRFPVLVAL